MATLAYIFLLGAAWVFGVICGREVPREDP
jgi:hypothetical protein